MAKLLYLKLVLFCGIFAFLEACGEENPSSEGSYCTGTGWVAFEDEKCFKLIKKWATREEAQEICQNDFDPKLDPYRPTLATIKTAKEQDSLQKYIYETSQVKVNVWIGAKRNAQNQFQWDDGELVGRKFSNWAESSPTSDQRRECVEMQSELMRKVGNRSTSQSGKWRDVTCEAHNLVVCEKLQRWSLVKIQETILKERVQNEEKFEDNEAELETTKTKLSATQNQLDHVEKNPVPSGFIYAQLPGQPDPQTIWPVVTWQDVTSQYAGFFFRAEGAGSAPFGAVQEGDSPRVTCIKHEVHRNGGNWEQTDMVLGGWSSADGVFSGTYSGGVAHHTSHKFFTSDAEVRPRNMAMKIWKRV